jgi:hypothetical protein
VHCSKTTLPNSSIFGGGKRDRTADLLHAMQALSQLSYTPTKSISGMPIFASLQTAQCESARLKL